VALLDEYRQRNSQGYNLNAVGRDYCNILKDESELNAAARYFGLDPKSDMWQLPARFVGQYAETDAANTLQIWQTIEPMLRAEKLWGIFDIEMRYCMVITASRMRGVRVDTDRAVQYRDELKRREAEASKALKELVGFEVPVWENDVVGKALAQVGIIAPLTAKTKKPSITAPWLKTLDHPVPKLIGQIRKWEKVRGTFIEGFFLGFAVNGRIYPQINPLPTDDAGTVSGRSSCTNPNLQQLSAKDPESAREVRGIVLPEEGAEIASLDYSQQEPRLAVHFAYLAGVRGAYEVVKKYRENPRIDFHQMVADLAKILRPQAKILNLALIYGKGPAATCHELGFETEWVDTRYGKREVAGREGQKFLDNYYEAVPFVPGLKEECKIAVRKRGVIRTLLGRVCRFGPGKGSDHKAVNALAQGSAADQLKKANVDMYEQLGEIPLMNVHDENVLNKWSDEQINNCVEIMVHTVKLQVPVVVDVATGKNWGEAL
jgi:DNA polymerase I-like protein with 3'-5' exonuclease and polymerase domains